MVKESIVMTVSDREPELLLGTLRWLSLANLENCEIVIVDDCSAMDYSWLGPYLKELPTRWVRMDPYECYRINGNYNNPAKAFNRCLQEAQGERILILSSDVLVPPRVLESARINYAPDLVYCPMTIDLASSNEYCGPHRMFPMPWFLYCNKDACIKAGGWDENYLLGMCYEDNDFVGRLALTVGKIVFDWTGICWHQSHPQPAYSEDQWIQIANARNRIYTMDKWTGMPFGPPDLVAFEVGRTRHEATGNTMHTFKDIKGIYERVVARTLSPFVEQPVGG